MEEGRERRRKGQSKGKRGRRERWKALKGIHREKALMMVVVAARVRMSEVCGWKHVG